MMTKRLLGKPSLYFLLFIAVVGFCVGLFLRSSIPFQSIDLSIDMEVDKGIAIEVYVNGKATPVSRLSLNPGQRQVYRFSGMPEIIKQIRIDPTDAPQANIKIYGLVFSRGEEKLRQLPGALLQAWSLLNVHSIETNGTFCHLESTTDDPIITQDTDYIFSKGWGVGLKSLANSLMSKRLAGMVTDPSSLTVILILLGLLILIIADCKTQYHFIGAPFLILLVFLISFGKRIVEFFLDSFGRAPPIHYAVGHASYFGYSKSLERLAFYAVILAALLVMVVVFFIYRKWGKGDNSIAYDLDKPPAAKPVSWRFLLALLGIPAVLGFPQLNQAFANLGQVNHGVHYDGLSMLTWQYETHMGWLPFKDFWYPYGGLAYIDGPFPWEMMGFFLLNFIVFASFALAVYWLVDRNRWWTTILVGLILLLVISRYITAPHRYFISLDYILLFLVLQREKKLNYFYYVLYGVFAGLFFIFDPVYFVYASLPMLVLLVVCLIKIKDKIQRSFYLKKVAASAAIFVVFVIADIVLLWKQGQFQGLLYFYKHLNTLAVSAAIPAALKSWFKFGTTSNHLLVYSIPFFIAYGLYLSVARKPKAPDSKCGSILLSTGLLSFIIFQKNLVRMHMGSQIIGFCVVGGLLYLYYWSRYWNRFQKQSAVFILLFLLGFKQVDWQPTVNRYVQRVPHLLSNMEILTRNREEIKQQVDSYFSIKGFQNIPGATEFAKYYREVMQRQSKTPFYVLGDDSFLYIIAKQKPPFHITLYGGCNIFDQKLITDWLEENKVEFVIWKPAFTHFDSVPNLVRVPNIYNHVIKHYEPYGTFATYQVLKRRDPIQPIPVEFWRRYLGDTIDLGHLPSITDISKMTNCGVHASSAGHEFLEVKVTGQKSDQQRTIRVNVGDLSFNILFWQNQKDDVYRIYLDHIWFWNCLKKEKVVPSLDQSQDTGLAIEILRQACKRDLQ